MFVKSGNSVVNYMIIIYLSAIPNESGVAKTMVSYLMKLSTCNLCWKKL